MKILFRFVNVCFVGVWQINVTRCLLAISLIHAGNPVSAQITNDARSPLIALGQALFQDASLSSDGKTSCQSCHNPAYAYADPHPRSVGASGKVGTRNAPSLVGLGDTHAFFWDGRRAGLDDVVLDPFTNPFELALPSRDAVLSRLNEPVLKKFRSAFGSQTPTIEQVAKSLAAFIRSLDKPQSPPTLSATADKGRRLFVLVGCSECHVVSQAGIPMSDGQYHHSGIGDATQSSQLPQLVQSVLRENLDASTLGPRVLTDAQWSELGRFVVSHRPADIGAFRTPSLRNVGLTAPYMHNGSIATLSEAVEHEIYYRSFSSGHAVNLTQAERDAIVAFLESLTDANLDTAKAQGRSSPKP